MRRNILPRKYYMYTKKGGDLFGWRSDVIMFNGKIIDKQPIFRLKSNNKLSIWYFGATSWARCAQQLKCHRRVYTRTILKFYPELKGKL